MIEWKCNTCGETVINDEETLWAHMQFEHEDKFMDCIMFETPEMLEIFFEKQEF